MTSGAMAGGVWSLCQIVFALLSLFGAEAAGEYGLPTYDVPAGHRKRPTLAGHLNTGSGHGSPELAGGPVGGSHTHHTCNTHQLSICLRNAGGRACYRKWGCPPPTSSGTTSTPALSEHTASGPCLAVKLQQRSRRKCSMGAMEQCLALRPRWPWRGCTVSMCRSLRCKRVRRAVGRRTPRGAKRAHKAVGGRRRKFTPSRKKQQKRGRHKPQSFSRLIHTVLNPGKRNKNKKRSTRGRKGRAPKRRKNHNSKSKWAKFTRGRGRSKRKSKGKGKRGKARGRTAVLRASASCPRRWGCDPSRVCGSVNAYETCDSAGYTTCCRNGGMLPWPFPWSGCCPQHCAMLNCASHPSGPHGSSSAPPNSNEPRDLDARQLEQSLRALPDRATSYLDRRDGRVTGVKTKKMREDVAKQIQYTTDARWDEPWIGPDYLVFGVSMEAAAGRTWGGGVEVMYDLTTLTMVGYVVVTTGAKGGEVGVGGGAYVGAGHKCVWHRYRSSITAQCPWDIVKHDAWNSEIGAGIANVGGSLGFSVQAEADHPAFTVTTALSTGGTISAPVSVSLTRSRSSGIFQWPARNIDDFLFTGKFSSPWKALKETARRAGKKKNYPAEFLTWLNGKGGAVGAVESPWDFIMRAYLVAVSVTSPQCLGRIGKFCRRGGTFRFQSCCGRGSTANGRCVNPKCRKGETRVWSRFN